VRHARVVECCRPRGGGDVVEGSLMRGASAFTACSHAASVIAGMHRCSGHCATERPQRRTHAMSRLNRMVWSRQGNGSTVTARYGMSARSRRRRRSARSLDRTARPGRHASTTGPRARYRLFGATRSPPHSRGWLPHLREVEPTRERGTRLAGLSHARTIASSPGPAATRAPRRATRATAQATASARAASA
jgi:hypothetical protein